MRVREVSRWAGSHDRERAQALGRASAGEVCGIYGPGVAAVPEEVYAAKVPLEWEPTLAADEHETFRWCALEEALELLKHENNKSALVALDEKLAR